MCRYNKLNKTPNILDFCDRSIVAFSHNFQLTQLTTSSCLASIFLLTATTSPMVSPERIIYWNSNSRWSPLLSNFCKLITTSQEFWKVIEKFLLIKSTGLHLTKIKIVYSSMRCNPVPWLNCCRLSKIWINIMMFLAFQTTNCIAPCISTTERLVKEQFLCLAVCGIYSPPNYYHNNCYYYLIIVNQAWIS